MSLARSTASVLALATLTLACAERDVTAPASADVGRPSFDMGESGGGTMCVLNTQLRPENEVPIADSEAKGHAQIKVRNDGTIEWKVFILNPEGEGIRAGHIHKAPATASGGVVQGLFGTSTPVREKQFRDSGELTPASPTLAQDLCDNPQDYYVNYHSVENPGGLARGQLGGSI